MPRLDNSSREECPKKNAIRWTILQWGRFAVINSSVQKCTVSDQVQVSYMSPAGNILRNDYLAMNGQGETGNLRGSMQRTMLTD